MCGPSGGGPNGNKRNKNVVEITEKSFQSPGTTGSAIKTGGKEFRRAVSPGAQSFAKGMAQLTGALSGIPGVGTLLASQVGPTLLTDESGKALPGASFGEAGGKDVAGTSLAAIPPIPSAQAATLAPEKKAQQAAVSATETKRKKARVVGRKSTILAGRKIAEEQLKTKLGQ